MLEWLSDRNEWNGELKMMANHIENVLIELLTENIKTKDIGGTLHTNEFTKEFLRRMF
jgi:isocitrate/isopropylmalate dehydrogenase